MEQYLKQGLAPDSKVLDIRQVDVSTGRFLEDNTPVYVITFTTQEVLLFRNRKTREVAVGAEDRVEQCNYAAVITRVEEELENELTGGWKVIEVRRFSLLYLCQNGTDDGIDGTSIGARISITKSILSRFSLAPS
jgi:mitochondrial import inner membrane translocase subunit TIM44